MQVSRLVSTKFRSQPFLFHLFSELLPVIMLTLGAGTFRWAASAWAPVTHIFASVTDLLGRVSGFFVSVANTFLR
jgi:hypothetical protein